MKKIAIIGASGFLGQALEIEFLKCNEFKVIATGFKRAKKHHHILNLLDQRSITQFINQEKPDFILYTAAEKHPDVCSQDPQRAYAINVDALTNLTQTAVNIGAWVLYFSTDYVFDGAAPPYKPNDRPHPLNDYGLSKLAGEQALWNITDNACVLRLPILYGRTANLNDSAVTVLASTLLSNDKRNTMIDDWAIRYPTHTEDVAIVCRQIVQYKMKYPEFKGTYHWSGLEPFTKYKMALVMAEILGISGENLTPQHGNDSKVARPFNCHLEKRDLEILGIGSNRPFKEGVREVLSSSCVIV